MALSAKSLFLYGFEITDNNKYVEFASSGLQTPTTAYVGTMTVGFYSLTSLMTEVVRVMNAADPMNIYSVTSDRTISGGLENRVTISTNGAFLTLFFGTGLRAASSPSTLLGFNQSNYTGATSYTSTYTAGTILIPSLVGYNYLSPNFMHDIFGSVNLSATGDKEAVVYNIQKFWQVEFKYEPKSFVANSWVPFMDWATQQRQLDFTPEITSPNIFFTGTLEKTSSNGKGLGYEFKEILPQFPNFYTSGNLKFRLTSSSTSFI